MQNHQQSQQSEQLTQSKNQTLLAAAQACVAEGWYIFPLHPGAKEPFACTVDSQGRPLKWYNGIHGGHSASNGPQREYVDKYGKTRKTTSALFAWLDGLECNVGIALELSGLTALDIDEGIDNEDELKEFLNDFHIPVTRAVRSGRTSSFGVHLLYEGAMAGSAPFVIQWRGKTVTGEVKSRAPRYVAAEGSFHKSGKQYTRLWDIPLTPTPENIFDDILANYPAKKVQTLADINVNVPVDASGVTQEEFEAFAKTNHESFTYAGVHAPKQAHMYLRDSVNSDGGCPWASAHKNPNHDGDFAVFVPVNGGPLSAKCQHESCKTAWTESSGWKSYRAWLEAKNGHVPLQPTGKVYVSKAGDFPNVEGVLGGTMPEAHDHQSPVPLIYPIDVWDGTLYAEYAALCTDENYIPKEFFVESLKTVVGAVVGNNLCIPNIEGGTARFYTVLIGLPSSGKNTAISWTTSLFEKDRNTADNHDLKDFGQYQLLWYAQDPMTTPELGACVTQVSSASGLARFLSSKGGTAQERLLFKYTEFASFLEKCGIDGSGLSLVSALCDLYDGTEFTVPALKDQKPFGGSLQVSILAGIQPERWAELGSGRGVEHSGIHSRWNVVPNLESKTVSDIVRPDLMEFEAKIRARVSKATPLVVDESARAAMKMWWESVQSNETNSPYTARLNIFAWRNALHHAWLTEKPMIDAESVAVGTTVADYQLLARKRYAPLIGDSPLDKAINTIRAAFRNHGAMTESQLKRRVNYTRLNQMYEKALGFLSRMGEVGIQGKLLVPKEGL